MVPHHALRIECPKVVGKLHFAIPSPCSRIMAPAPVPVRGYQLMLWKSTADPKLDQCGTTYAVRPRSAGTQCRHPCHTPAGTVELLLQMAMRMAMHLLLRSGGVRGPISQAQQIPAYSSGWPSIKSPGLDELNATSDGAEI